MYVANSQREDIFTLDVCKDKPLSLNLIRKSEKNPPSKA